jgi:hypothetical protein
MVIAIYMIYIKLYWVLCYKPTLLAVILLVQAIAAFLTLPALSIP